MKKNLLFIALFVFAGLIKVDAQIYNNSFENWSLDTFYLPANQLSTLPADTVSFYDPVMWTSSNSLTKLDSIGGSVFVTQSNNAYSGNSAIQLRTDTVKIPLIAHLPLAQIIIPGFALNGIFPFSSIKLNGTVSVISPISVDGAGQPFTQRLQSISGFYNYTPAFNTLANANDTCVVWATLRKGKTDVADAIFKSTTATGGYAPFTANFNYVSCEQPDTLVILIASSVPNVANFLGEGDGLPAGSVLLIDSLTYDTLPQSHIFAPFAKNDVITMYKNTIDTINVLANDTDCSGVAPTVSIVNGARHGTSTLLGSDIVYTPTTGYTGLDTINYRDTNGSNATSDAVCIVFVNNNTGINDVNLVAVSLYPVPADNLLHIQFQNPGKCTGNIYDIVGNKVMTTELNSNNNGVSIQGLPSGVYGIELLNNDNTVIGRNKFVIAR